MGKYQKVKKFIEVSEMGRQIQMFVDQIADEYRKIDENDEVVVNFGNEVADRITQNFGLIKQQISDYIEELYLKLLSESELDALITFHSSSIAVRMRELSPEIVKRVMKKTTELMEEADKALVRQE